MDITFEDRLSALQQISQRKLVDILDSIRGKKDLIIEQKLMKPLDSFIGASILKRHGVDKIFKLEPGLKPVNLQRIFLTSCDLISCKRVLDQIHAELSQNQALDFHILITPFVPPIILTLIEEEGLADMLSVRPITWELIQIDGNILSLELPIFCDLYYHNDSSLLPALSRSLWSLQMIIGWPKLVLTFGKHSENLSSMIDTMRENAKTVCPDNEIGAIIIMDRSYDFVSTLLTPVSYVGLLSEVIPISISTANLEGSNIKLDPKNDQVYQDIRDIHFSDVFPKLKNMAKTLKSEQESTQTMKLEEMGRYIATKLQKTTEVKKQLAAHITICEAIVNELGTEFESLQAIEKSILDCTKRKECLDYIERNIDDNPMRSLRLLCLLSITSDGLMPSELKIIQKSYLHAHGYHHISLFHKLERIGFLKQKKENILRKLPNWKSEWTNSAQRMKLIPNQNKKNDEKLITCPSYVYSGAYIPAIAQFLNIAVGHSSDPKSFEEMISLPECRSNRQKPIVQQKTVIVCVIGGLTFGEISACRLIEKSTGSKIVLVSDCLLTGSNLMKYVQDT
ncbi:hypothetical protein HCN44_003657 [Aphidius gifuensis]|uniref:Vacuolar protein sorting-associated protein 33B n=1 Tax=Aphidius gifuensis TaxID=684658 RepID=A0A835CKG8_APHGI|nr:vacuolar protein sorting-associated protein 33B [Aphidius gifuensis]KAF7987794.1 hypothetical protein HCN44_003657 [Aphidius gifuensis]